MLPLQSKYRLAHPENHLFSLSENIFSRWKYPKKKVFSFFKKEALHMIKVHLTYWTWFRHRKQCWAPVTPFQPTYRLGHPDKLFILIINKIDLQDQSIQKWVDLILKKTSLLGTEHEKRTVSLNAMRWGDHGSRSATVSTNASPRLSIMKNVQGISRRISLGWAPAPLTW